MLAKSDDLNGGAFWTVPELVFESKKLIPSLQQLIALLDHAPSITCKLMDEGLPAHKIGKKRVFLKEDLIKWIKEH